MRLGLGETCALNISIGRSPRECRQVVCTHLSGSLEARSEFDQRRFAKSCSEKADAYGYTKYYPGWNLNNGITRRGGQPRRPKDEMVTVEQVGSPSRIISGRNDCIEVELFEGGIDSVNSSVLINIERLIVGKSEVWIDHVRI